MKARPLPRTLRGFALAALPVFAGCASAPLPAAPPTVLAPSPAPPAPVASVLEEAPPALRLPTDVRPAGETLVPLDRSQPGSLLGRCRHRDRPRPTAPRRLDARQGPPRHARDGHADGGASLVGEWKQRDDSGVASLTLPRAAPRGARDAPRRVRRAVRAAARRALQGHARRESPYAFTQFESICGAQRVPLLRRAGLQDPVRHDARRPRRRQAIAQHPRDRPPEDGGHVRVRFARRKPLPSYLVAFAVGPFDVVAGPTSRRTPCEAPHPPARRRAEGPGAEIGLRPRAARRDPRQRSRTYFGIAYPYDKLDIVAVPAGRRDGERGRDHLRRVAAPARREDAPLRRSSDYAEVMAHELAHQWLGDLVTVRVVGRHLAQRGLRRVDGGQGRRRVEPQERARRMDLLEGVQCAMGSDALVSAREIRQPIARRTTSRTRSTRITYQKGGGVLAMFERWVGPRRFQRGVRDYLTAHRFGNATADDFLDALSPPRARTSRRRSARSSISPACRSSRPRCKCDGAPRIAPEAVAVPPAGLDRRREQTWQMPVCARYAVGKEAKEACTLLTRARGRPPARARRAPTGCSRTPTRPATSASRSRRADLAKLADRGFRR